MSARRKRLDSAIPMHGAGITLVALRGGEKIVVGVVFPPFEFPDEGVHQALEAAYDISEGLPLESVLDGIHEFLGWEVHAEVAGGSVIRGLKTHVREVPGA